MPTPRAGRVIPAPHVSGGPGLPVLTVPKDRGTGPQNADVYFAPLMWRVPVASLLNLFAVRAAPRPQTALGTLGRAAEIVPLCRAPSCHESRPVALLLRRGTARLPRCTPGPAQRAPRRHHRQGRLGSLRRRPRRRRHAVPSPVAGERPVASRPSPSLRTQSGAAPLCSPSRPRPPLALAESLLPLFPVPRSTFSSRSCPLASSTTSRPPCPSWCASCAHRAPCSAAASARLPPGKTQPDSHSVAPPLSAFHPYSHPAAPSPCPCRSGSPRSSSPR